MRQHETKLKRICHTLLYFTNINEPYDEIDDGRSYKILFCNDKTGSMRKELFTK